MRVITACDVIPGVGRQGLRLLARPAPAALGVPPRTARTRPALRARRHPEGTDPQQVARRVSAHAAGRAMEPRGADNRRWRPYRHDLHPCRQVIAGRVLDTSGGLQVGDWLTITTPLRQI